MLILLLSLLFHWQGKARGKKKDYEMKMVFYALHFFVVVEKIQILPILLLLLL